MNIAIIAEAFGIPTTLASTSFISNVASGLTENGHQVKVFVMGDPELCVGGSTPGIEVKSLFDNVVGPTLRDALSAQRLGIAVSTDYSVSRQSWYAELLLYKGLEAMKEHDNDGGLILCYSRSDATMGVASNVAGLIGWSLGAFATEVLTDNQIDPLTRDHYIELVRTKTDFLWAVSGHLRDYWGELDYPKERIFTNCSVAPSKMFNIKSSASAFVDAVFTGNLGPRYANELIAIASIIIKHRPDLTIEIYGDDNGEGSEEFLQTINNSDLSHNIKLCPSVPPSAISTVLQRGRLLLAPCDFAFTTGTPHKVVEYFASGGLVVASDVGDLSEMFESGQDCFLAKSTEEFAEMVVKALELSDKQRRVIGKRGREHAAYYMDAKVVTERMILFQEPLAQRHRVRKGQKTSLADILTWYKDYRRKIDKPMVGSALWFKRAIVALLRKLGLKEMDE